MIRVLVMIAVSGFILCVATMSAAVALGGPAVLSHAAWTWGANRAWDFDGHWDRHGNHDGWADWSDDKGPPTTREIAWTGGGRRSSAERRAGKEGGSTCRSRG